MRRPLFRLGFAMLSSLLVAAAVACGGTNEGSGAKSPTPSGAPADPDAPSGFSASDPQGAASPTAANGGPGTNASSGGGTGGTTTTNLADGGELQGAKLGGKVHTETESKGEGGPKSTHGQSANEAGRSVKDIQTIVSVRRDEARACYDKALATHPGIEGDLDIKWIIDPQGNVTEASVDTTRSQILEPTVGSCIIDVIKRIKFAASAKGYETRAHYLFNFHPKKFSGKDAGR